MTFKPIKGSGDFRAHIVFGKTRESRTLEFKSKCTWKGERRDAEADELARDIAQFANSEGGVLLIGVSEQPDSDGGKVAAEGPGVDEVDGLMNWIQQAVRNHLVPATFKLELIPISLESKTVLAVNVHPSLNLVALWHPETKWGIEYLYRTDHGKEWMNPDEVERHLMNGSRAARLAVQRVWNEADRSQPIQLVPPIVMQFGPFGPPGTLSPHIEVDVEGSRCKPILSNMNDHEVEIILFGTSGTQVRIPYGLVREAWTADGSRPALALWVRIISTDTRGVYLEPLEGARTRY